MKRNYLELALFIVFIISFIVCLMSMHSVFSSISDIVLPNVADESSDYFYDSVLYAKKALFTNVPMMLVTLGSGFLSFKYALKERNKDKLTIDLSAVEEDGLIEED